MAIKALCNKTDDFYDSLSINYCLIYALLENWFQRKDSLQMKESILPPS